MFARRLLLDFAGRRLRGAEPFATWEVREGIGRWQGEIPHFSGPPLEQVRTGLNWARDHLGSQGAALGFVGYEFARYLEPSALCHTPRDDLGLPEARLVFCRRLAQEEQPAVLPYSTPAGSPLILPDGNYQAGVRDIRALIASGDIYQANLTHRFVAPLPGSPSQLYERLRAFHPMPHAALLEWDDFAVVSNSPELFLKVENRIVSSAPIKGTIRRGATSQEDAALKEALRASPKDRAENVMIVDLVRNDLGRVCEMGSVRVPQLFEVQTFGTLHHLVSQVQGELRPDCDAVEAFGAAFPCGSITGAPKIRAMQVLEALEPVRRGVAMGAIGYFGFDGNAEWNVAIRTATCLNERAYWHAGGGIVWDSNPADEEREMLLKASAIARALSGY